MSQSYLWSAQVLPLPLPCALSRAKDFQFAKYICLILYILDILYLIYLNYLICTKWCHKVIYGVHKFSRCLAHWAALNNSICTKYICLVLYIFDILYLIYILFRFENSICTKYICLILYIFDILYLICKLQCICNDWIIWPTGIVNLNGSSKSCKQSVFWYINGLNKCVFINIIYLKWLKSKFAKETCIRSMQRWQRKRGWKWFYSDDCNDYLRRWWWCWRCY